jgi:hypothetical protein
MNPVALTLIIFCALVGAICGAPLIGATVGVGFVLFASLT